MARLSTLICCLFFTCVLSDIVVGRRTNERTKVLAKRGLTEDILTAGSGPVCAYIISFTYTMAKYQLEKLTQYLSQHLPSITKRDLEAVLMNKADLQMDFDLYGSLVTAYRSLSCKLIVSYLKTHFQSSFQMLVQYITDNIVNIVG